MHETLKQYWQNSIRQLHIADAVAATGWAAIEKAYTGRGRHYHTLNHLSNMAELVQEYRQQLHNEAAVWPALFYHDIVYKATRSDNEERSAAAARIFLQEAGQPDAFADEVVRLILATKRHETTGDFDTDLFTDIDVSILGAPWPAYEQYARQVRKEYRIYPDFMYKPGRRKVLEHFLQMPFIFKTPAMQERFERQAKENLRRELEELKS